MADEVIIEKDAVYLRCYHHILDSPEIDIELIWGGRDSGKSKFVAQCLLEESMAADYFRCILIKQTHESIKDAQWQMIKDTADEWGVDSLFQFNVSPLQVICQNGNRFIARGMDSPGKIRSITNPSHAWIEEGNQLSEEAFITILTGLRSNRGNVKLYITFNPESTEPDYLDFWLYRMFFAAYAGQKSFTGRIEIKNPISGEISFLNYRSTHTTYHDNPFVTSQRIAFHESLKATNYYWYRVFTLGEWGNAENDSPWAFAFSRQKHVSAVELHPTKRQYLWLSFDFNRNPHACQVIQHYDGCIWGIESIKIPKTGTEGVCEYILQKYPGYLYVVTGDYSGNTASSLFKEQVSNYTVIKRVLRLNDGQIRIKPNPPLAKNQLLVNAILAHYKVQLCPVKCKPLIFDMEKVRMRPDGTIEKGDRDDISQQADILDCWRYFCAIDMAWFVNAYK